MRSDLSAVAPFLRHRDGELARQVAPGQRRGIRHDLGRRPLGDDFAAMHPGPRPHVDQVIGLQDRLFVMLHHQHGVADVAQPLERAEQAGVVALVQADGRLVQDVEHPDQA